MFYGNTPTRHLIDTLMEGGRIAKKRRYGNTPTRHLIDTQMEGGRIAKKRRLLLDLMPRPWPKDPLDWTEEDFTSAAMVNNLQLEPSLAQQKDWISRRRQEPKFKLASTFLQAKMVEHDNNSDLLIALDLQVDKRLQKGTDQWS